MHTYKYKPWVLIVNVLSLLLIGFFFSIPVSMVALMLTSSNQGPAGFDVFTLILLFLFGPIAVMMVLVFLQVIASTIATFFAYIRITPEGIEHKVWPGRHIFARWSDVDRLGDFFLYKSLYLKSYEVIGFSQAYKWPWKYLNFLQASIPVSAYNGWPNGQLAADLRRYAPRLFETTPVQVEQAQPTVKEPHPSGISEEDRLLAAFAHAAILFAGIFVPIIIFVAQKKKSPFLSFHLLQAFYFQLTGAFLVFVLPVCGFIGTLFPVISAIERGNGSALPTMSLLIMLVWVVLGLMLTFGNFGFITYGLVGAFLAYQGKAFRYALIGNAVAKTHPPE